MPSAAAQGQRPKPPQRPPLLTTQSALEPNQTLAGATNLLPDRSPHSIVCAKNEQQQQRKQAAALKLPAKGVAWGNTFATTGGNDENNASVEGEAWAGTFATSGENNENSCIAADGTGSRNRSATFSSKKCKNVNGLQQPGKTVVEKSKNDMMEKMVDAVTSSFSADPFQHCPNKVKCTQHPDRDITYGCLNCHISFCKRCSEFHHCPNEAVPPVVRFEEYASKMMARFNKSSAKNSSSDTSPENPDTEKKRNLVIEHINRQCNNLIDLINEIKDQHIDEMNSSMSTSSQILSEDTHLNHVKASNTIENFLKKQKSDLPIYKQEGYADLVESVQVFESCANTTTVSSLEEFDITSKIHAFDTILEKKISAVIKSYAVLPDPVSETNPTKMSGSSLMQRLFVSESIKNLSLNEFVHQTFGNLVQYPGNSPADSTLYSNFKKMLTSPTNEIETNPQIPSGHNSATIDGVNIEIIGLATLPAEPKLRQSFEPIDKLDTSNVFDGVTYARKSLLQIKKRFGELGPAIGQFNSPHGFCIDAIGNILIADTNNHRILFFNKDGDLIHYFGTSGKSEGQLWYPRKIAVMGSEQNLVICDRGNERSRMQIFTFGGDFLRRINIRFIDIVASIAIQNLGNNMHQIIVVDSVSPTVYVISEQGEIVRWFDCSDFMKEPSDLAVYNNMFFICDFKGHQVVVFTEDGQYKTQFGGENLTNFPNGIDISPNGDILVGDSHGNRFHLVVYNQNFEQVSEFECPFVKVSRCCGLKVSPNGLIVTLAKNNHHVLIINQVLYTINNSYNLNFNSAFDSFRSCNPGMVAAYCSPPKANLMLPSDNSNCLLNSASGPPPTQSDNLSGFESNASIQQPHQLGNFNLNFLNCINAQQQQDSSNKGLPNLHSSTFYNMGRLLDDLAPPAASVSATNADSKSLALDSSDQFSQLTIHLNNKNQE